MARRTVRVAVAVVARQQSFEGVDEVVVAACAGLDDRDAGGGVRDEHVAQAVAVRRAERAHLVGEIDDASTRGVDVENGGIHDFQPVRFAPIARLGAEEEPDQRTGGATGALPRTQRGSDRVRTIYHY